MTYICSIPWYINLIHSQNFKPNQDKNEILPNHKDNRNIPPDIRSFYAISCLN